MTASDKKGYNEQKYHTILQRMDDYNSFCHKNRYTTSKGWMANIRVVK